MQPTIEWKVAGACNYDCSYCIQSRRYRRGGLRRESVLRAVEQLARLDGTWELKMSGGEAFAHPLFLDLLVPELMARTPHRVSVLTNFSSSARDLMRFVRFTRGRLEVFSASLHVEYVAVEDFVAKAAWLANLLEERVGLVVNQVVIPGQEAEAARCRRALEAVGIRWFPQLMKVDGQVVDYPDRAALSRLLGDLEGPGQLNTSPSYRGHRCWAGVRYFAVEPDGSAWSCRSARRVGEGKLGNLYEGTLSLWEEPRACPFPVCPCTVPANRGMIEDLAGW